MQNSINTALFVNKGKILPLKWHENCKQTGVFL